MSSLPSILARWSAGAALLFAAAGAAVAQQDAAVTLAQVTVEGPVLSADLDAALAALQGRPMDDALLAEAEALVRDYYDWLEWRDVQVSAQRSEEAAGNLQFRVEAQPPLPPPEPPVALAEPEPAKKRARKREAPILATDYDSWLRSPARVLVDADQRRLWLKRGQQIVSYTVAVGTENTPTPPGVYRVEQIAHRPTWYPTATIRRDHAARGIKLPSVVPPGEGNPLGAWFVRLQDSIGIHGTNEPASIGQASSYGCVRMHERDLEELARTLRPGDRVLVIGEPAAAAGQQVSLRDTGGSHP
ncbi:L,D-transpeptidase [Solimonas sp. SE-A11]|uniref:L,D-transpeptidase n=1 Tax=Solimonas sp. SE-A11 TaxID=3054954 RepID=UPI00259D2096|nr:L,D-transpeptidase [Solimonas sp. SE-A11]MDM4772263.1 L,D-transpeptidase [Solimonas sp. SE-A11]